jgi:ADP-dependent NAD(P)H-hydrate dehydratase / NAD(P)H-hydrate epimerase
MRVHLRPLKAHNVAMKKLLPSALYTAAQVRELDRRAIEDHGIAGYTLMERAGQAAFDTLRRRWPGAQRLGVLCGPGNNGGDGYVIARLARAAGLAVWLVEAADPGRLKGDAARARADWTAAGGEPLTAGAAWPGADVLVDALLGTGLDRAVEGRFAGLIDAINAAGLPVLAVDIPSGLNADTGAVLGRAVRAAVTVSFIGLKTGLFTGEGPRPAAARCCSTIWPYPPMCEPAWSRRPSAWTRPVSPVSGGARAAPTRAISATCWWWVVTGACRGAARMAGEAAARTGAGLVSVATHPDHAALLPLVRPELMVHGVAGPGDLYSLLARSTVLAVGPGLGRGDWGRGLLARLLETGLPMVVDADALNLLAGEPVHRETWVLTPHPGEAGRLLGTDAARVQADRLAAAARIQQDFGGVCVLKGAGTVIRDGRDAAICTGGNPGMASGGMGDVLTGVIAALIAQGVALPEAARLGVCIHAEAADRAARAGERGLLASDVIAELRAVVNP